MNPSTSRGLAAKLRLLALLFVTGAAPACGATSLTPSPTSFTDSWSGSLAKGQAFTYPFTAQQAGTVSASYTSVGTDNSIPLGLAIGTWNGTACDLTLLNDSVTVGLVVSGSVSAAANLCVRVYDVGYVINPLTFVVQVVHP
jgi:hypothetical protein